MKKEGLIIVTLFIAILLTAAFWAQCADTEQNVPKKEVGICHKCGQEWIYKLIKESALQGHLRHGDFLYKGRPDVYPEEMDDWCNINAPQP